MSRFTKPYIYWNQALRQWVFSVLPQNITVRCETFREAIAELDAYYAREARR